MEFHIDEDSGPACGKENLVSGKALFNGTEILCPVSTSSAVAIGEQSELRAYKLGKQKCSYNQVELLIKDMCGKASELRVSEAIEAAVGNEVDDLLKESCLKFNVRFVNNARIHLYIYVVYASPYCSVPGSESKQAIRYYWVPVTRSKCRKGCKGPVIRGLQRFGRMSRRAGNNNHHAADPYLHQAGEQISVQTVADYWKEPRHLYIAIDEASTHVCPRPQTSKFRLLVAAYDDHHRLLGSTVSSCIRVLANNDAPLGAASFKLHCHIEGIERSASLPTTRPGGGLIIERRQCCRIPLQDMTQNNPSTDAPRPEQAATNSDTTEPISVPAPHYEEQDAPKPEQASTNSDTTEPISMPAPHYEEQELELPGNEQCTGISPSSSCCAGETPLGEGNSSLYELCQRVFEACSCKQERVITLRKFATILGASRNTVLEIFSVLEILQVVQEQGKEKYIWLGSNRIENALQEIMLKQADHKNAESSLTMECDQTGSDSSLTKQCANISELSRRFCLLFLSNEGAFVKWEFAVEAILDRELSLRQDSYEIVKSTLWKVSVILSALHLIASKKGPVFEWTGSEGVAAHLKSAAEPWLRRCQNLSFHKASKRKRADSEETAQRDQYYAADEDMGRELVPQICGPIDREKADQPPSGKRVRISIPAPCLGDSVGEIATTQQSCAGSCRVVLSRTTATDHGCSLLEAQDRRNHDVCPSSVAMSCQDCISSQGNPGIMICCDEKIMHGNGTDYKLGALHRESASHGSDEVVLRNADSHYYRRDSIEEQYSSAATWQPMPLLYSGCEDCNNEGKSSSAAGCCTYMRQDPEEKPVDFDQFSFSSAILMLTDNHQLSKNGHPSTVHNVDWDFDPFAYLQNLFTPQQVVSLQQYNPGFLFNFVRYYRQLYHRFGRKTNTPADVTLPLATRPTYYPSFCQFEDSVAKHHNQPFRLSSQDKSSYIHAASRSNIWRDSSLML